jgi:hypothetical protein
MIFVKAGKVLTEPVLMFTTFRTAASICKLFAGHFFLLKTPGGSLVSAAYFFRVNA